MTAAAVKQLHAPAIGAVEIKRFIKKNTLLAFMITVEIFAILFVVNYLLNQKHEISGETPFIHIVPTEISLVITKPIEKNQVEDIILPPGLSNVAIGIAYTAGNPVPVPDVIVDDFAPTEFIGSALPTQGELLINTDLYNNTFSAIIIDIEPDVNEINIEDIYTQVDFEPSTDLAALQKRIKYPVLALQAGVEGKVIIRVLVGKKGNPKIAQVQYTDNVLLNKAAVDAVMQAEFSPAIQNSKPIDCWVSIPINFKIK